MDIGTQQLRNKLKSASSYCFKEAEIFCGFDDPQAVWHLSQGVRFQYLLNGIENPEVSLQELVEGTVRDCLIETRRIRRNLGNAIVHSRQINEAQSLIDSLLNPDKKLFWQGYLQAEYWDNKEALQIFRRLADNGKVLNLHWYGNLLSKLGKYQDAKAPLEKAAEKDPGRYNHHSHLGNVYRALGMRDEAERSYKKAARLLAKREWGRVEFIHLVRCYHGLSQLGLDEYSQMEKDTRDLALSSGLVKNEELERIKF
jgi:tetratricopeptide (TPR) repeat protein